MQLNCSARCTWVVATSLQLDRLARVVPRLTGAEGRRMARAAKIVQTVPPAAHVGNVLSLGAKTSWNILHAWAMLTACRWNPTRL